MERKMKVKPRRESRSKGKRKEQRKDPTQGQLKLDLLKPS